MKSKTEHRILFGPGGCITREAMQAYIDGLLSDKELRKLKAHARKCQLCADSLDGAGMFKSGKVFSTRLSQMGQSRFRRNLDNEGKSRKLFYGISSAAASIAIVFGVIYILKYQDLINEPETLAEKTEVIEEEMPVIEKAATYKVPKGDIESEVKTISEIKTINVQKEEVPAVPAPKEKVNIDEHVIVFDEQIEYEVDETAEDLELMSFEFADVKEESKAKTMASDLEGNNLAKAADKKEVGFLPLAYSRSNQKSAKKAFYIAEVKPMFRGGDVDDFSRFVADSLKVVLPDTVLMQSVVVGFKIDTSGNVKNVKLISGTDSEILNEQILIIIENSPQ